MSDYILKIIPMDRAHVPAHETHRPALELLEQLAPGETEIRASEELRYIDAGEALAWIVCPRCRARLDMYQESHAAWYSQVDEQLSATDPESLTVTMPCCKADVRFTELELEDGGGFARFEIAVWNPDVSEYQLPAASMALLEKVLGCPLRQIWAHY
jgi:hypothetical protein